MIGDWIIGEPVIDSVNKNIGRDLTSQILLIDWSIYFFFFFTNGKSINF